MTEEPEYMAAAVRNWCDAANHWAGCYDPNCPCKFPNCTCACVHAGIRAAAPILMDEAIKGGVAT